MGDKSPGLRLAPFAKLLGREENIDKEDKRPIPFEQIKEETFEQILIFCEKSGYDDRRKVTRRRLLEKPDINLSYEELYKKEEEKKEEDTVDEMWKAEFFKALKFD